jgi:hypothetical protein
MTGWSSPRIATFDLRYAAKQCQTSQWLFESQSIGFDPLQDIYNSHGQDKELQALNNLQSNLPFFATLDTYADDIVVIYREEHKEEKGMFEGMFEFYDPCGARRTLSNPPLPRKGG